MALTLMFGLVAIHGSELSVTVRLTAPQGASLAWAKAVIEKIIAKKVNRYFIVLDDW